MRPKLRRVRKAARALVDPKPRWVSLVRLGANQVPFEVHKGQHVIEEGGVYRVERSVSEPTAQPNRIEFASMDKPAAKAWLDDRAYEGYTLVDGSPVVAKSMSPVDSEEHSIKIAAGITAFVAVVDQSVNANKSQLTEDPDMGQKVQTGAEDGPAGWLLRMTSCLKALVARHDDGSEQMPDTAVDALGLDAKTVEKFNHFLASISADTALSEVLAAGDDGFPFGFHEVMTASVTAMQNSFKEGDTVAVKKVAADMADALISLHQLFVEATAKGVIEDPTKGVVAMSEQEAADKAKEDDAAKAAEDKAAAEKVAADAKPDDKKPEGENPEEQAAAQADPAAELAKSLKEALTPLTEGLEKLSSRFDEMESSLKDDVEKAAKAADDASKRVDDLAGRSQTRKSAEDEGGNAPKQPSSQEVHAPTLRALGGRVATVDENY